MVSTQWKTNLILLLLVIVLSSLTYVTQQDQDAQSTPPMLSQISPNDVISIQILKKGNKTSIKKNNSTWHITQPINIKANQFRIGSLLKLLTTNNYADYEASSLDLNKFGLSSPSVTLLINDEKYGFGIINPINKKRYVIKNKTVYLIDDIFYPLINSQLGTLVDQKLLSGNIALSSIQTNQFVISKNDKNLWGSTIQSSADSINALIDNWKNAQAFGVHDYSKTKIEPLDKIQITLEDNNKPIDFIVKSITPWLVIARPDLKLEYHFDADMYRKLLNLDSSSITDKKVSP